MDDYYNPSCSNGGTISGWNFERGEEFQEEDMWGVYNENDQVYNSRTGASSSTQQNFNNTSATAMIAGTNRNYQNDETMKSSRHSAPVNIPDWSKIYGKKKKKEKKNSRKGNKNIDDYYEEDGYGDEDEIIPPHEMVANKLARTRICSPSMCEGVGRTLKGRDLRKVRDNVLSKTGFIE